MEELMTYFVMLFVWIPNVCCWKRVMLFLYGFLHWIFAEVLEVSGMLERLGGVN